MPQERSLLPVKPGQVVTIPCLACGFTIPFVAKPGSFSYTFPDCGRPVRVSATPRQKPPSTGLPPEPALGPAG